METNNWEFVKSKQWDDRTNVFENGSQIFAIEHNYQNTEDQDEVEKRILTCVNGYDALQEENKRLKDALRNTQQESFYAIDMCTNSTIKALLITLNENVSNALKTPVINL